MEVNQVIAKRNERRRQHYAANREQVLERNRQYYEANREQMLERKRQRYTTNREQELEYKRQFRAANREKMLDRSRRENAHLRTVVLAHYGESCACCGTTERLSIDHVNGDGKQHREELFGGVAMYRWLVRNAFPEGFQTLCMPCNRSKGTGESCRLTHAEMAA